MPNASSDNKIVVRIPFEEKSYNKIREAASAIGLTLSSYVRMVVLQKIAEEK